MRRKACIGKRRSLSLRLMRYRLQSFGNLCDIRARRASVCSPSSRKQQTTPISPQEQTHNQHRKHKPMSTTDIESNEYKKQFLHEATRLAIESVEKGWGGPFGAVIVRDGKIIGRGQNRVLLTGIPVFHAEVTATMDAFARIHSKALLG